MLNFRYHIVSLVAVFLALGVGVIMGSAVIDSTTIDVLEEQSAQLEERLESAEGRVAELEEELERARASEQTLAEQGAQVLLDERLAGVPVVLVTAEGVDGGAYEELRTLLSGADAALIGTVRLRSRLTIEDQSDRAALAEILGRSPAIAGEVLREGALTAVVRAVTGAPFSGAEPDPFEGEPSAPEAATILALAEAGFVELQPAEGSSDEALTDAPPGTGVVVAWGPGATLGTEDALTLVGLLAAQPGTAVVVTSPQPAPDAGEQAPPSLVGALRSEPSVADAVSTVDNVDTFAGRLATALALEAEGRGSHGHFGTDDDAHRLLPAPPEAAPGE